MQQPPPLPPLNPYAAPVARVDDWVTGDLILADRGIRLVAFIVDYLIVLAPVMVMGLLAATLLARVEQRGEAAGNLIVLAFVVLYLAVLVINCVLLHRNGQTIGKRMMGIKVLRIDGTRCGLARIIFARGLPIVVLMFIPLVNYVIFLIDSLMIFRGDHRCLHDLIADTIVVKA